MDRIEYFKRFYKEQKEKIDKKIASYHHDFEKEELPIVRSNLQLFSNLNSDGKRIRGVLVNLGYGLLKDDIDYSLDLSLAYELFQTAILVHDDVIDHDQKRRGVDTIHYANQMKYSSYGEEEERKQLGEAIAICMGDYGSFLANLVLVKSYSKDEHFAEIQESFYQTVLTTIRGELLDVVLPFEGKYEFIKTNDIQKNILEIYRLKTAHYTIVGPLCVGLLLADGNQKMINDLTKFGEKVGIAFQIQDDILGIYSDEMGKVKGSDIKEFKQTILFSHIMNTSYKEEFLNYYGKDNLEEEKINRVKELFILSGSKKYAEDKMNDYYNQSLNDLEKIDWIDDKKKDLLRGFIEYLRNRNK
jgi:geranylgeranyl pyrophosphate synthase